ncbi:MAG TPA: thioredoxin family protein [Spirochaetia bacterium]|nr:thioredoxin family protein [Spirochaetia bacterium]
MTLHGIIIRLILAAAISGLLVAGFVLVRTAVLARARRVSQGLTSFRPGVPGIVYFTTPDCVTCKSAQRPALRALEQKLAGQVQVIEVDAVDRPDLAQQWSVLSVPTTFILDREGKPRQVNHGFASAAKLLSQLQRVS